MAIGRWNEPVTFETQRLGQYRTIASAEEAARALLTDWPADSGHAFMKAQKRLYSRAGETQGPEAARKAFLAAEEEAGVFVRTAT
ncbi:DUF982 domain-containing protein [Shinella zoogloeoides]|uniref:DUF982 domain-containing protein n=1 Tax=Shinella zoogloeoides TaxID=352475 RepID=UPI000E65197D